MSFEYWITADHPIPEVAPQEVQFLRVQDMIERGIPATGALAWEEMNREAQVMYIPDPDHYTAFSVQKSAHVPKGLAGYIHGSFIYHMEIEKDFASTLQSYIEGLDTGVSIEIWNLWAGYDVEKEPLTVKSLSRSSLSLSDLEIEHTINWCIRIT